MLWIYFFSPQNLECQESILQIMNWQFAFKNSISLKCSLKQKDPNISTERKVNIHKMPKEQLNK